LGQAEDYLSVNKEKPSIGNFEIEIFHESEVLIKTSFFATEKV